MRMPSDKDAIKSVFDIDPAFGQMAIATWTRPFGRSHIWPA